MLCQTLVSAAITRNRLSHRSVTIDVKATHEGSALRLDSIDAYREAGLGKDSIANLACRKPIAS